MKLKHLLCAARTQEASPSPSSSLSYSSSTSDSDSDSDVPSPRCFDRHGNLISAGSFWQYNDPRRSMQTPTISLHHKHRQSKSQHSSLQSFIEAQLRAHARETAIRILKAKAKQTFWHLQDEERAVIALKADFVEAVGVFMEAVLTPLGEEWPEDPSPVSMDWAIEQVERKLVLQEEADAAYVVWKSREMGARMTRSKMEGLKCVLIEFGEWKGVQADIRKGVVDESESEVEGAEGVEEEREDCNEEDWSERGSMDLEDMPPLVRIKGNPFCSSMVCESRPALARRHAAGPWAVSWDM
ncbi:hypothetical protein ONS95_005202 [Cadophora gregata]|uniref:uncharacterized protein n=1 Tax=Cadophora gregata TaxID=51156 RepID=UPI0026DC410A|nr:uncharacterized protein ONS95_005202 [Cadophora gregata]KAK0104941.1 hypothetical protein ONS95_005202 [Cadophora gregata]KAK0114979.1 hypothetical protein ONS96_013453 [Cadophora gregata f. sp. sojae]